MGAPDRELDRIRWNCRRGLLELDLVLQRFLERRLASLDAEQTELFKQLLAFEDNDLLDMVMGRAEPVDGRLNGVLTLLRS
jgi:antitoxin CptB